MKRKSMYLAICLEDVKKIASKHSKNDVIAEKLGLTRDEFNYINYYQYLIVDDELRNWAIDFSIALETGKALYKLDKLQDLNDLPQNIYLSELEKKYKQMKLKREKEKDEQSNLFD